MPQLQPHPELSQLHSEWVEINERLRERESQLAVAISVYVRGFGPRPDSTIESVKQMREECARRFQALMSATKGDSRTGGD